MPNLGFSPNQPEYYTQRARTSGGRSLTGLMMASFSQMPIDEQETAKSSKENLLAALYSSIPTKADSPSKLKELVKRLPGLKLDISSTEKKARRELSARARKAICETAANLWSVNRKVDDAVDESDPEKGKKKMERTARTLLSRDDSDAGMQKNWEMDRLMKTGSPEEKGKELTKHVNETYDMLMRVKNGQVTDEELVEQFEFLHVVHNMTMNAQLFKTLIEDENSPQHIKVAPEILEKLKFMEIHSGEVAAFLERARMIASPNYEHLNMEYLLTVDPQTKKRLQAYLAADFGNMDLIEKFDRTFNEYDMYEATNFANQSLMPLRKVNLMEQIQKDFPDEKELAQVKFVDIENNAMTTGFTLGSENKDVDNNFHHGHVLVTTPSGDMACYYVTGAGKVTKVSAADMMNEAVSELQDVLREVHEANKGLFIGSKEYSTSMSQLEKIDKEMKKLGTPPSADQLQAMEEQLKAILESCNKYIKDHEPTEEEKEDPYYEPDFPSVGMPERRRIRYDAMERAAFYCKRHLAVIDLHKEAMTVERKVTEDFYRASAKDYAKVEPDVAQQKVAEAYSAEFAHGKYKDEKGHNVLSPSNVGNSADELRASVKERLDKMISDTRSNPMIYDGDLSAVRNVMSDMVVLELVKKGRTKDGNGNIIAGEIEQALAESPGKLLTSFRNHPFIRNMTDDMSLDKLRHFVVTGGAKTMADHFLKVKQQNNPGNVKNEPNKEMDKVHGMGNNL